MYQGILRYGTGVAIDLFPWFAETDPHLINIWAREYDMEVDEFLEYMEDNDERTTIWNDLWDRADERTIKSILSKKAYPEWRRYWGQPLVVAEQNVKKAKEIMKSAVGAGRHSTIPAVMFALNTQHVHGSMMRWVGVPEVVHDRAADLDTIELDAIIRQVTYGIIESGVDQAVSFLLEQEWW